MARSILILTALCLCTFADEREAARASHSQERITWANRTGLPLNVIERFWRTTMGDGADEQFGQGIEIVDASSLRSRNQTLFVTTAGNGHCLHIYVFDTSSDVAGPLWQEDAGGPGGICHERLMPYPTVYASPAGEIIVQVPTGPAWVKRRQPLGSYPISTAIIVYTYRWNGGSYKLAMSNRVVTYRSKSFGEEQCPSDRPCN